MVCFTKLVIFAIAIELAIFIVGMADRYLRGAVAMYNNYVPAYWWLTEVWAEMNTNQQPFKDSLPSLPRMIWAPITIFVAGMLLLLVPGY